MKRLHHAACLLALLALSCASPNSGRQRSLTEAEQAALLAQAVSPPQAGIVISQRPSGTVVRWREMAMPERPVTVPLLTSDSRHSRQPMVAVRINAGQPVRMVLDTGSPVTLVDADTALANHVQVVQTDQLHTLYRGLGGEERAFFGMIHQMTIGPELAFRNVLTAIRGGKYVASAGFHRAAAWQGCAVGMSTLGNFAFVTLDFPAQTATLSYRDYFLEPDTAVARVPFKVENAQIRVPLKLGERTVEALLDTGNDAELMIHSNLVRELGWQSLAERGSKSVYLGLGGALTLRSFHIPDLQLGGARFGKVTAVRGPEEFGVVLGSGFLSRYRITLDLRRKQLWLEQAGR